MAGLTTAPHQDVQGSGCDLAELVSGPNGTRNNVTSRFANGSCDGTVDNTDPVTGCFIVATKFIYLPWDNPDNIITLKTSLKLVENVLGIFIPLLSMVGLPVNVLSCVVFFKQGLQDRINLLLFCLAIADFFVQVYMFLFTIEYLYSHFTGTFQHFGPFLTVITNNRLNCIVGFAYVSGFISTLIACERCLCVTYPLKAKKLLKTRTAGIIVVVATVILVGVQSMTMDKFKIGCIHYLHLGFTDVGFYPGQFYLQHTRLVDIVDGVVYGLCLPCVCVALTTTGTIITIVTLKSASARRRQMTAASEDNKKEVALTKMLVAISIFFVTCTSPNIATRIVPIFIEDFQLGGRYQNLYMSSAILLHVTYALNSSLNFFFYLRMGSKFRQTLKEMCCKMGKCMGNNNKQVL